MIALTLIFWPIMINLTSDSTHELDLGFCSWGNGLLPTWCQAIIWTNCQLTLGSKFHYKSNQNTSFIQKNAFESEKCCLSHHIGGFLQDCSNSLANILELLQSCTKPLMYSGHLPCGSMFVEGSAPLRFVPYCWTNTELGIIKYMLLLVSSISCNVEHMTFSRSLGMKAHWSKNVL